MNIFDHSHNETFRMIDGEILFRAGQPARHIYLIERGQINILTAEGQHTAPLSSRRFVRYSGSAFRTALARHG